MTRKEKKSAIEKMATAFTEIDSPEVKSMAAMSIHAYLEGKTIGAAEERKKWEKKFGESA